MVDPHVERQPYLTPREIAEAWRCTPHHVRALVRSGQLRGFRIGSKMIVSEKDASAYLERRATAAPQAA
jgi:excisionase family DNA binding protein